ncbi:hypothetical protein HanPSC8_Chr17g0778371 [Helianthus annuus]|nr:hypothetical protein HanPSC8_Chr17g0778371 [Helianthus annuus]
MTVGFVHHFFSSNHTPTHLVSLSLSDLGYWRTAARDGERKRKQRKEWGVRRRWQWLPEVRC